MKKLVALCLSMLMVFGLAGCSNSSVEEKDLLDVIKERGYMVLSTSPDFAPQEFYAIKDGKKQIVGTDILLAQAIADEIGVELRIEPSEFTMVITNVQTGLADIGISGFSWTEKRAESVIFSDNYAQVTSDAWQGIMVRTADASKYKTLDDIKAANLKIGAQTGSIQYEMASHLTDEANIVPIGDNAICAQELQIGGIDAYIITSDQAKMAMQSQKGITLLPEDNFNLDPENKYGVTGAVFAKGVKNEEFIKVVNKVINDAKAAELFDKWDEEVKALLPYEVPADETPAE